MDTHLQDTHYHIMCHQDLSCSQAHTQELGNETKSRHAWDLDTVVSASPAQPHDGLRRWSGDGDWLRPQWHCTACKCTEGWGQPEGPPPPHTVALQWMRGGGGLNVHAHVRNTPILLQHRWTGWSLLLCPM